ncbi:MAG: C39 family peptidase [Candidatus Eremiobacteraeota bacterium]|nr:C39 family peptidase [Candidatus Eremiobacteraeota bacterium]
MSQRPSKFNCIFIIILLFLFILNTSNTRAFPQELQKKNFQQSPFPIKKQDEKKQKKTKTVIVPHVEYRSQNEKGRSEWCVIYSTYMLLTRYGIHAKPEDIAKKMGMGERNHPYLSWKSLFSEEGSVERYLQREHNLLTRKKIFVTLRKYNKRWIKKNLKKGNPVLFLYGRINGHAVLLVGYDDKYVYMNDPSGAFFSEATRRLKRNVYPEVWCKEKRKSRYEHAGVLWSDLEKFLKRRNLWGYMVTVVGKREAEKNKVKK